LATSEGTPGGGSRRAFNEQLRLFGSPTVARRSELPAGPWAALALALVVVPWALIGWAIWMVV
jgi:hypothetical protein